MPDLERELRDLGSALAFPPTPDLAPTVGRRLAATPAPRAFAWRRAAVVAFAVLAVAVGAVMAVPQARTAILEWLGLRGVTIERVPTPPAAPARPLDADLGEGVTLAEARARVPFPVVVPRSPVPGDADDVYVARRAGSPAVTLVWRDERGEAVLLLTQFRASLDEDYIRKVVGPDTRIERVRAGTAGAFWVTGAPHEVAYARPDGQFVVDTVRLAGDVLLWQRGDVTLRLEGAPSRAEARRVARSAG